MHATIGALARRRHSPRPDRAHARAVTAPGAAPSRAPATPAFEELSEIVRAAGGPLDALDLISVAASTAGPPSLHLEVAFAPAGTMPADGLRRDIEFRVRAVLPHARVGVSLVRAP